MAAPPLTPNTDIACPICATVYLTANHALSLNCSSQGCRADLCYDCANKAVFTGADEAKCPHCRRAVDGYGYAAFSLKRKFDELEDRTETSETTLKKLRQEHREALSKVAVLLHEGKLLQKQRDAREQAIQRAEQSRRAAVQTKDDAEDSMEAAEATCRRLSSRLEAWERWGMLFGGHASSMPRISGSN